MHVPNLNLDQANLLIVKNFLSKRRRKHDIERMAPILLECLINSKNLVGIQTFLVSNMISNGWGYAFIDAYVLDHNLYEIKMLSKRQVLTEAECSFFEGDELLHQAHEAYREYLKETNRR